MPNANLTYTLCHNFKAKCIGTSELCFSIEHYVFNFEASFLETCQHVILTWLTINLFGILRLNFLLLKKTTTTVKFAMIPTGAIANWIISITSNSSVLYELVSFVVIFWAAIAEEWTDTSTKKKQNVTLKCPVYIYICSFKDTPQLVMLLQLCSFRTSAGTTNQHRSR